MLAGSAAIAAYLFSARKAPLAKGMEIVGPLAFVASMALWPKIAIQLPSLLINGVDPMKKYQDSQGRIKPFFQDPQFIPWDLYSDKQMDKIGDRLGVPKDISNRRAFTQEKMRKVAVQNNTLWMLTAGLATPLMTALACNKLEKPIGKKLDEINNQKADNLIKNFAAESSKVKDASIKTQIDSIVSEYAGKNADKSLIDRIAKVLSKDQAPVMSEMIKKDLAGIVKSGEPVPSKQLSTIAEAFTNFKADQTILKSYYTKKLGNVPESVLANHWNETAEALVDALGFTKDEYKQIDRKNVGRLLNAKLEKVTSNSEDYKRVLSTLTEKMSEMTAKFTPHADKAVDTEWFCCEKFVDQIKHSHDSAGKVLADSGMSKTAAAIAGDKNSLKYLMLEQSNNRVYGVKSALHRWVETLDFFRRAKTTQMDPKTVEIGKKVLVEGHAADFITKFEDHLTNSHDYGEYSKVMKELFGNGISAETRKVLEEDFSYKNFSKKYLREMMEKFGNEEYFAHQFHRADGWAQGATTSLKKFLLSGVAEDEYVMKVLKNKYNSQKWLKMFSKFGLVLGAVTIGSQFFFGKIRKPDPADVSRPAATTQEAQK
jgi:hypothetical protein